MQQPQTGDIWKFTTEESEIEYYLMIELIEYAIYDNPENYQKWVMLFINDGQIEKSWWWDQTDCWEKVA